MMDPEAHQLEGELELTGVGSIHRRVVPPTRMAEDVLIDDEFDDEEAGTQFSISFSIFFLWY